MKKIIILLGLMITICGYAQRKSWIDSLTVADITGADTIIWATRNTNFYVGDIGWSMDLIYHALDADDATFSIVVANQDSTYNTYPQVGTSAFPFTLDVTTNGYTNQSGNTVASNGWHDTKMEWRKFGIKVTPGLVTAGKIHWEFRQK